MCYTLYLRHCIKNTRLAEVNMHVVPFLLRVKLWLECGMAEGMAAVVCWACWLWDCALVPTQSGSVWAWSPGATMKVLGLLVQPADEMLTLIKTVINPFWLFNQWRRSAFQQMQTRLVNSPQTTSIDTKRTLVPKISSLSNRSWIFICRKYL